MSLTLRSSAPGALLSAFKKAIDEKHVVTWSYDKDGDFTHTPEQWKTKAWLRAEVQTGQLFLYLLKPQNSVITWDIYAVYQGRFIESMIAHCHGKFSDALATAKPGNRDQVS